MMVRKQRKRTKEIDLGKILPPLSKVKGITRVGEMEAARQLNEQMREMRRYPYARLLSKRKKL